VKKKGPPTKEREKERKKERERKRKKERKKERERKKRKEKKRKDKGQKRRKDFKKRQKKRLNSKVFCCLFCLFALNEHSQRKNKRCKAEREAQSATTRNDDASRKQEMRRLSQEGSALGSLEYRHIRMHPLLRRTSLARNSHLKSKICRSRFLDRRTNTEYG
jgi:outer membrane biosynthesis protein TonB